MDKNCPNADDNVKSEDGQVVAVRGCQYGMLLKKGVLLSNNCAKVDSVKGLKMLEDDIVVATYAKSGTTLTEEIVWLIMNNVDTETATSKSVADRFIWLDLGADQLQIEYNPKETRFFKSHIPAKFLPENLVESKAKIIYVVRNPKDVLASSFNFFKNSSRNQFIGTFDDLVENFLEGKFWYGPWWEHVDDHVRLPNVLVVHFEDLIEKPFETIKSMASYLGKSCLSDAQIEKIVKFTRFQDFKDREEMKFVEIHKKIGIFNDEMVFFRKGEIGDWRNYFSEEQAKRVDDFVNRNLKYNRSLNDCMAS